MDNIELDDLTLKRIAKNIDKSLPKDFGFVLLTFKFNESNSKLMYISNSNRSDVIKAMEEWIDKVNSDEKYGKDL